VVLCFRDFTLPTTISIAGSRSVRSGLILILILILIDWYSSEREESWWLFFFSSVSVLFYFFLSAFPPFLPYNPFFRFPSVATTILLL
jgi:ABC-type phosphate/phosphonate transport system permease subunit